MLYINTARSSLRFRTKPTDPSNNMSTAIICEFVNITPSDFENRSRCPEHAHLDDDRKFSPTHHMKQVTCQIGLQCHSCEKFFATLNQTWFPSFAHGSNVNLCNDCLCQKLDELGLEPCYNCTSEGDLIWSPKHQNRSVHGFSLDLNFADGDDSSSDDEEYGIFDMEMD